jgi:hypothetical protein
MMAMRSSATGPTSGAVCADCLNRPVSAIENAHIFPYRTIRDSAENQAFLRIQRDARVGLYCPVLGSWVAKW